MQKTRIAWALAALVGAAAASGQTLDEVLAKNYATKGGLEQMNAVKSARFAGTMTMGPGMEAPFVLKWARPNKIRLEFTFQGMTGIQAFDGETGWSVMPFMGKTEPDKMGEEELKQVQEMAEEAFEGALVNYKEKGHQVELLGKEDKEGTPAYKVKVAKKNGDVTTYYLDADSGLEFKSEGKVTRRGQEFEFESSIGDYKEVGGLVFAHSLENRVKGMPQGQVFTIEKIELNPELPAGEFAMPPPKPAAEAPKPPSR